MLLRVKAGKVKKKKKETEKEKNIKAILVLYKGSPSKAYCSCHESLQWIKRLK